MDEKIRVERKKARKGEAETRLYAPTRDTDAYAYDEETGERLSEPTYKSAPIEKEEKKATLSKRDRILLIVFIFLISAMVLFVLYGYSQVAAAYSNVNDLNDSIDELNIHISALNASIECAVTIDDAQNYAVSHGMQYPTQDQYISEGQSIPSSGSTGTTSTISGTFGEETTGDTTAAANTDAENAVTDETGDTEDAG